MSETAITKTPVGGHPDWTVVAYNVRINGQAVKYTFLQHTNCGWLPNPVEDKKCSQCREVAPGSAVGYVLLNKLAGGII